jgi:hypothetical protein
VSIIDQPVSTAITLKSIFHPLDRSRSGFLKRAMTRRHKERRVFAVAEITVRMLIDHLVLLSLTVDFMM